MISRKQLDEIIARERIAKNKGISLDIMKSYYKFKSIYQETDLNYIEIHNKALHELDNLINSLRPKPKQLKYF